MDKPGKWFTVAKCEKKKKEILRKEPGSLLKTSLWGSFQFLLVQISLVSPQVERQLKLVSSKQLMA